MVTIEQLEESLYVELDNMTTADLQRYAEDCSGESRAFMKMARSELISFIVKVEIGNYLDYAD